MKKVVWLFLVVLVLGFGFSCKSPTSPNNNDPDVEDEEEIENPVPGISVSVSPAAVTVKKGGTWQFSAEVENSEDQSVLWSVSGLLSDISETGLLSVDVTEIAGTELIVTAVSVADDTKSGTAVVTVADFDGLTGSVVISGNNWPGQTLTADTSLLAGSGAITYQWKRGSTNAGANSASYTIVPADVGQSITVVTSRASNTGTVTSNQIAIIPMPLTLTITSGITYSNNHNNRNAITPILDGTYTERTAAFTAAVSGFNNAGEAAGVGLTIPPVTSLGITGNSAADGVYSNGTKTFTITATYNGTTAFSTGMATISITGVTNIPAHCAYSGSTKSATVSVIDGQTAGRAIPLYNKNIASFNRYMTADATKTEGLKKHYKLTENITADNLRKDLGADNNWAAIGECKFIEMDVDTSVRFSGSFNGQGFSIFDLKINLPSANYQGMFGCIAVGVVIKNTGLIGGFVIGNDQVGGIVGNTYTFNKTVENCFTTGTVIGKNYVGSIVGFSVGTVKNCYSAGSVISTGAYAGGIVGENFGTIENSHYTGIINGNYGVGGISGRNYNNTYLGGIIDNCYSTGSIIGKLYVGGIAGDNSGTIENCYTSGSVNGNDTVGGIAGSSETGSSNIKYSYSCSIVNGVSQVGGVAGFSIGVIENCYASGSVNGEENVGGVVGYNNRTIKNCYAESSVNGTENVGGVAGSNTRSIIENCYATGIVIGTENVGGIVGLNIALYFASITAVQNCTALNQSISGTTNVGRVIGNNDDKYNYGTTFTNNYANSGMTITPDGTNHVSGTGVSLTDTAAANGGWWKAVEPNGPGFNFGTTNAAPWVWDTSHTTTIGGTTIVAPKLYWE